MLNLFNKFELKIVSVDGVEETLKGTFRDYTKQEVKEIKENNKEIEKMQKEVFKLIKDARRLDEQIEIAKKLNKWDEVSTLTDKKYKLEDKMESYDDTKDKLEETLKARFNKCLSGDDKDKILEYCEQLTYERMMKAIQEAIAEGKQEDKKG